MSQHVVILVVSGSGLLVLSAFMDLFGNLPISPLG